jgi:hypothetical protein
MKSLTLFLLCIGIAPMLFSQKKSKAGYHLDDAIYAFNISYTGSMNYSEQGGPNEKLSGGALFLPGRFDLVSPWAGVYGYAEANSLLNIFIGEMLPTSGLVECGYSWMFNNEKVSKKNSFVSFQYGMGIGGGIRIFRNSNINNSQLYGVIWPEITGIISVGNNLDIMPKLIINPWPEISRVGSEALVVYRLLGPMSLTGRIMRERFILTKDGESYAKAVGTSFQLGFAINISTGIDEKYSRD